MFLCFPNSSLSAFLACKLPNERRIYFQQGFASRFPSLQQIHFQVGKGNKSIIYIFVTTFLDLKEIFSSSSLRIVLFPESNTQDPFWIFSQAMAAELLMRSVSLSAVTAAFAVTIPQREHQILAEVSAALPGVH